MKIMYMGIAVWPSWEIAEKKMWIWRKSIDRFNYRFFYYGVGTQHWPNYRGQKIETPLEHLRKYGWGDCTHVLYTDCCDCLMLAPPGEIEAKYEAMGCPPMLVSGSDQFANVSDHSRYPIIESRPEQFKYPHVGGYLMEPKLLLDLFEMFHAKYPHYGDDCFCWYDAIEKGEWNPVIDTGCEIFQVHGEQFMEIVDVDGIKRIKNTHTGSTPAIWHNAGGYASHDNYKDDAMRPMAETLGILVPGEEGPKA
jgi:hypothetical protein